MSTRLIANDNGGSSSSSSFKLKLPTRLYPLFVAPEKKEEKQSRGRTFLISCLTQFGRVFIMRQEEDFSESGAARTLSAASSLPV